MGVCARSWSRLLPCLDDLPDAGDRPSLQNGQAVGTPCPLHVGTPAQLAFDLFDHNEQRFQVRLLQQRFGWLAALAVPRPKRDDLTRRSAQQPVVGVHAPVDETGARSGNRFNHGSIVLVRPGITAKSDAGAVLCPHFLDQHGHPAGQRVEGQFLAVQQRCIRPQGRPHQTDRFEDRCFPHDIQERFVQPRKGPLGRIFSRS